MSPLTLPLFACCIALASATEPTVELEKAMVTEGDMVLLADDEVGTWKWSSLIVCLLICVALSTVYWVIHPHAPGKTPSTNTKVQLALGMSFAAGYADVVCLIRYKAFATMMTGNLLQIGRTMVEHGWTMGGLEFFKSPPYFMVIIACRMLGVVLHQQAEYMHDYGTSILAPVIVLFTAGIEIFNYVTVAPLYPQAWNACILAVVFGVQSSVSFKGCLGIPTTMATGHMQSLTFSLLAWRHGGPSLKNAKSALDLTVTIGLVLGAIIGAWAATALHGTKELDLLITPIVVFIAALLMVDDRICTQVPAEAATSLVSMPAVGSSVADGSYPQAREVRPQLAASNP